MRGFPIPPIPPALFIVDRDLTDESRSIVCKQVTADKGIRLAWWGIKVLLRIARFVPDV